MLNDVTLTPIEDLFTLNKKEILPYEFKDQVWISVTIEMDLILKTYERTGYTLFDLLSDIGGLSGILMTFFTSFMAIWNYNSLDNLLVQSLFKTNKEDKVQTYLTRQVDAAPNQQNTIKRNVFSSLLLRI